MRWKMAIAWVLLGSVFVGCGSPPTVPGNVVTPGLPVNVTAEAPTPLPAQEPEALLTYTRAGGIAGFCDTLVVSAATVYRESCNSQTATFALDEVTRAQLTGLAQRYASFEQASEDNPGGADSLHERLWFGGTGSEAATDEVRAELRALIERLLQPAAP